MRRRTVAENSGEYFTVPVVYPEGGGTRGSTRMPPPRRGAFQKNRVHAIWLGPHIPGWWSQRGNQRSPPAAQKNARAHGTVIVVPLVAARNSLPRLGRTSKIPVPVNPNPLAATTLSPAVSLDATGNPARPETSGIVMSYASGLPEAASHAPVARILRAPEPVALRTSMAAPLLYSTGRVPWNRNRG